MSPEFYLDLVFLVHFLFALFATIGGFLMLYSSRAALLHLPALAWGIWIELSGDTCPLTGLENHYRQLAGKQSLEGDWLVNLLEPILYPSFLTSRIQLAFAGLLLTINLAAYGLWYFKQYRPDRATRALTLVFVCSLSILAFSSVMQVGPIAQPLEYHDFADQRSWGWIGLPHALNVLSNFAIFGAGVWGWLRVPKGHHLALRMLFLATMLTGLGSGYYHLAPDNEGLLYDRLGMSLTFACFLGLVIADRFSKKTEKVALLVLSFLFLSAAFSWYYSELLGQGNMIPYVFIQVWPMLVIPYILWLRDGSTKKGKLFLQTLGIYILAFAFDRLDGQVYEFLANTVSGHTWKHLIAGFAVALIVRFLPLWHVIDENKQ